MLMQEAQGITPLRNATPNCSLGLGEGGTGRWPWLTGVSGEMSPGPCLHRAAPDFSILLPDLRDFPGRSWTACLPHPIRGGTLFPQVRDVNPFKSVPRPRPQSQHMCDLPAQWLILQVGLGPSSVF